MFGYSSVESLIEGMMQTGLNANQYMLLLLMFKASEDPANLSLIYKYCHDRLANHDKPIGGFSQEEITELIDKNYLKLVADKNKENPYLEDLEISSEGIAKLFVYTFAAGLEFFDRYPPFIKGSNGQQFPAKSFTKKYNNMHDFFKAYAEIISSSIIVHRANLEAIKIAEARGEILVGIVEWMEGRMWRNYEGQTLEEAKPKLKMV